MKYLNEKGKQERGNQQNQNVITGKSVRNKKDRNKTYYRKDQCGDDSAKISRLRSIVSMLIETSKINNTRSFLSEYEKHYYYPNRILTSKE